jgi:hypothetical protein
MPDSPGRHLFEDANHWRKRAAEMRALAVDMADHVAQQKLLETADQYDRVAERAEQRRDATSDVHSRSSGKDAS